MVLKLLLIFMLLMCSWVTISFYTTSNLLQVCFLKLVLYYLLSGQHSGWQYQCQSVCCLWDIFLFGNCTVLFQSLSIGTQMLSAAEKNLVIFLPACKTVFVITGWGLPCVFTEACSCLAVSLEAFALAYLKDVNIRERTWVCNDSPPCT